MMKSCLGLILAFTAAGADLPVRTVVLYKHGVGYFERAGDLAPGSSARLDFRAAEMDDVLKSLTIVDQSGGKVSGLRYDSSLPLKQKLAEFPFRVGERKPMAELLDELKGARVELKTGGAPVAGMIVSGRVVTGGKERPSEQVTLLLDSGEIQTVDLASVVSVRFAESRLQEQFRAYLATVADARAQDRRSVYIDSTGSQSRSLAVHYVIPTAVWKSSYRLVFDSGGQATLEGWAIVDNTTGEDWSNVRLSLVSGRPISFISRLYEPKFITRQAAELPEETAAAPPLHEGALGGAAAEGLRMAKAERLASAPAPAPMAAPAMRDEARRDVLTMQSSVAATATGRELGDLFEYRMPNPVSVPRNGSAMLPFLQQKIAARKLLIYSDESSRHPYLAAELANSTGNTLDGGPITVLEQGAYGGEALFETLKQGDKRLISYAVDLGTRITTAFDSRVDAIRQISFRRGILSVRRALVESKTYTIRNVDAKAKTLVIEHPLRPDYKLLEGKPAEKTPAAYRFEVALAAGAERTFPVVEERVIEESHAAASLTPDVIFEFSQGKGLPAAARQQLERLADLKRQIAEIDRQIQDTERELDTLAKDQNRLRQNIDSLNRVANQQQQVQTYAQLLASQETRIAALRDRRAELQRRRNQLEADLSSLIETLQF
jgi:hypothetical protein